MDRQWIKASEIGEYLYCQRAWWYRLQDAANANVEELRFGTRAHASHGLRRRATVWLRWAALALVLLAIAILFVEGVL